MREVKIDSMDCHADKSARNDRKRGFFTQDSRACGGFFHHLQIFLSTKAKNTYKDFRIFDEKSGLSSDWQGSYLSGNDRRQSRRIHDLSQNKRSGASAAQQVSLEKDKIPQRLENA